MLDGLVVQEVIGLFPEGGLIGIVWGRLRLVTSMLKTLLIRSKASVRYGKPLQFPQESGSYAIVGIKSMRYHEHWYHERWTLYGTHPRDF